MDLERRVRELTAELRMREGVHEHQKEYSLSLGGEIKRLDVQVEQLQKALAERDKTLARLLGDYP